MAYFLKTEGNLVNHLTDDQLDLTLQQNNPIKQWVSAILLTRAFSDTPN